MSILQLGNDSIQINGIRVSTIIGVLEKERVSEQPIQIDLKLEIDLSESSLTDELDDTANYGSVTEQVYKVAKESKDLLLERLAQRVADEVLSFQKVLAVEVTITKLRPPIPVDASSTSVNIWRKQSADSDLVTSSSAVIALGSNIGDRMSYLRFACDSFDRKLKISSIYETEPIVGPSEQDAYLNLVLSIETSLDPHALLRKCQRIEAGAARQRTIRWGPRTLDVDILFYEGCRIESELLTIPHPRINERRFVLTPLWEIHPELCPANWSETLDPEEIKLFGSIDESH